MTKLLVLGSSTHKPSCSQKKHTEFQSKLIALLTVLPIFVSFTILFVKILIIKSTSLLV